MPRESQEGQFDQVQRKARIAALANRYLGDEDLAQRWLERPNLALGGRTPLSLLDTDQGARAVENVLGRIAYGSVS